MWKLIIKQKRKYTHTDAFYTESVEFVAKEIEELALMVVKLSKCGDAVYTLEKVGEVDE